MSENNTVAPTMAQIRKLYAVLRNRELEPTNWINSFKKEKGIHSLTDITRNELSTMIDVTENSTVIPSPSEMIKVLKREEEEREDDRTMQAPSAPSDQPETPEANDYKTAISEMGAILQACVDEAHKIVTEPRSPEIFTSEDVRGEAIAKLALSLYIDYRKRMK